MHGKHEIILVSESWPNQLFHDCSFPGSLTVGPNKNDIISILVIFQIFGGINVLLDEGFFASIIWNLRWRYSFSTAEKMLKFHVTLGIPSHIVGTKLSQSSNHGVELLATCPHIPFHTLITKYSSSNNSDLSERSWPKSWYMVILMSF